MKTGGAVKEVVTFP